MSLFVTQGRFTREYIKGGLANPEDRQAAIARLSEQAGGKLVSFYFTLGQYDFMVISEMPDAKAASVLAFVTAGGGGIEGSVTTQAFTYGRGQRHARGGRKDRRPIQADGRFLTAERAARRPAYRGRVQGGNNSSGSLTQTNGMPC